MHICKKLSLKIKVKKKVQKENLALTNHIGHKQIDVFCHFVAAEVTAFKTTSAGKPNRKLSSARLCYSRGFSQI